jgi:hypothetical protein
MTDAVGTKEAHAYRYQGRWFTWRFLEEWSFDSQLSPEELHARLNATWEEPFRVFGRRAWRMYRLCAVFRRDGSIVVRDFDENRGKFARPLDPVRLTRLATGQRFIGRIKATEKGSRLEGWAEYGNFGRHMATTLVFLALIAPEGFGAVLAMLAVVSAAIQCMGLFGSTLLASRQREAFWRFLEAATRTPPGEPLLDDVHLDAKKLKEMRAGAS